MNLLMSTRLLNSWSAYHTKVTWVFALLILGAVAFAFPLQTVAPVWFIASYVIIFWYFYLLYKCNKAWQHLPKKLFIKKLFWRSFFYRALASILIILIAELVWEQPHYVGAVDAVSYYNESRMVMIRLAQLEFAEAFYATYQFTLSLDSVGITLLMGLFFTLFGDTFFIGTLFMGLLGSIAVVYLYKTTAIIWDEERARTAGILFMHFPFALFYSVIYMKEGFIVFIIVMVVYVVTRSINGLHLNSRHIFGLFFLLSSLFFFRVAIAASLPLVVLSAFLLTRYKGSKVVSIFIGLLTISVFISVLYFTGETEYVINRLGLAENFGEQRQTELLSINSEGGNIFGLSALELAGAPVFVILAIVAPFAQLADVGTVFNTGHDHNQYIIPASIIWNMLSYFSIIGFYYSIKEKFLQSYMVWGYTAGYLYILVETATITRDRFAYVSMPLLLILAAIGIYKSKNLTYWYIYLMILVVATVAWNYLRLSSRGLL